MSKFVDQFDLGENQPQVAHMFKVVIGAFSVGSFLEASNLTYEIQPYELVEGGRNYNPHMKPYASPGKRGELTLKWGSVKRDLMQAWIESVEVGYLFRRNIFLFHMNRAGVAYRTYTLTGCWPKMWKAADLNTSASEIATEELPLVYNNLYMLTR